jgi:hypothetical protein
MDVCGVLTVNAHELPVTPVPTQALYANISLLEHSCINNASKHFDGDFRVVVRAAVNIKKGEHISINYSDPMWGTTARQLHLGETKYFTCHCERCSDPTELGTMFSSIRCPQCTVEQIMLECWKTVPYKRPTFEFLAHMFEDFNITSQPQYME